MRAARLYARRWPLYLLCAVVAFAANTGIDLSRALDPRLLDLLGSIVILPTVGAIVYGFVANDSLEAPLLARPVWERVAERLWAVIAIDAIPTLLSFLTPETESLLGILSMTSVLILTALLMYADVQAIVAPETSATLILQQSILASARTALTRLGYLRAMVLVLAQIGITAAGIYLNAAVGPRVLGLPFFASTVVFAVVVGPFAALVTTIYLDLGKQK